MTKRSCFCAALIAATLWAGQVAALSCMRPDVSTAFDRAAQSDDTYVILLGTFAFAPPPPSDTGNINAPRVVTYPARFDGAFLGVDRFQQTDPLVVTVTHACSGPWCGSLVANKPALAFVQMTDRGFDLEADPCGTTVFYDPAPEMIARVEACMRAGSCAPTDEK